jgi:DNA-binding response OmpR family regulator
MVILAVDDEPDVLETLSDALDMCEVVEKTSYADAVEYIENNQPDLVILDIMGVNGFVLLKHCVDRDLPVVMLTARSLSVESLNKSIMLGARAYLPKQKITEIVPFLEDAVTMKPRQAWQRLFDLLGEFFTATLGRDWHQQMTAPPF